jgi:hypothetical protein
VSTRIRAAGTARRIWRAASSPFISGIAMSRTTTSGWNSVAFGNRFAARRRFAADGPIGIGLEQDANTLSHNLVIIRDEDLRHDTWEPILGANGCDFQRASIFFVHSPAWC